MHTVTHKYLITYGSRDVSIASGPKLRACVLADIKAPFIFSTATFKFHAKKREKVWLIVHFHPLRLCKNVQCDTVINRAPHQKIEKEKVRKCYLCLCHVFII